jgi:hypothetical protein
VDAHIPRVDLVDKAANGLSFLIAKSARPSPAMMPQRVCPCGCRAVSKATVSTKAQNDAPDSDFAFIEPGGKKDAGGKTTPRSLRHFYIADAAHVRNALARASQSPFGDKAMPKIKAAAKKFGVDITKEAPVAAAVTKAEPEAGDGPIGDGTDVDLTEVFVDPDDTPDGDVQAPGSAPWEAIDAASARKWTAVAARLKVALEILAGREAQEAVTADPDDADNAFDLDSAACAVDYAISVLAPFAVGEQMEADTADDMAAIGKALAADGVDDALFVLEALGQIRKAGRVLSSANEASIRQAQELLTNVLNTLPQPEPSDQPVAKEKETPMPEATKTVETPVVKADDDPTTMQAVFDAKGNLCGVVDPANIVAVSGGSTDDPTDDAPPADPDADATTIPGTDTVQSPPEAPPAVAKSAGELVKSALAETLKEVLGEQEAVIKTALTNFEDRLARVEATPAPKSPVTTAGNGEAGIAARDNQADPLASLLKARESATSPAQREQLGWDAAVAGIKDRFARR